MSVSSFRKLLLASECTEFDAGAERVALAMASAQAVPLSVVFPLLSNPEYEAVAPQAAARAEREVARALSKLHALAAAAGVTLDVNVRRGSEPDQEIIDEARRSNAELLILRRRGKHSFLSRLLIGEMVGRVLDYAPCHVLVVPRLCKPWQRGVMVVAESSDTASAVALAAAGAAMARDARLSLSLLVVSSGDENVAHTLDEVVAASSGTAIRAEAVSDERAMESVGTAMSAGVDLLVVKYGTSGTPAGELMRRAIGACDVPVLAVRGLPSQAAQPSATASRPHE